MDAIPPTIIHSTPATSNAGAKSETRSVGRTSEDRSGDAPQSRFIVVRLTHTDTGQRCIPRQIPERVGACQFRFRAHRAVALSLKGSDLWAYIRWGEWHQVEVQRMDTRDQKATVPSP
jgi:hypothetical protein